MSNMLDVLIIGGGMAGLTASIYIKRSGLSVKLLEASSFGGQIASSPKVENFPTIKSISGLELIDLLVDQVVSLDVDIDVDNVTAVIKKDDYFEIIGDFDTYLAKSVIIATGCTHRKLNAYNIEEYQDNISYCAICDGSFYKDEEVTLIGDGNTALQYSLYLSNICKKVYVCTLNDRFFGEEVMVKALLERANVEIIHNVELTSLQGADMLSSLTFLDKITNKEINISSKGLFIAIGQVPNNSFIKDLVDLDETGYIITNNSLETKTKGLYAIGDCRQKELRQLTTAVSDAAIAATKVLKYLNCN